MLPTLNELGDIVIVDRLTPRIGRPISRNDVIIAASPTHESYSICKRVVGLPGDKISPPGWRSFIIVSAGLALALLDDHNT